MSYGGEGGREGGREGPIHIYRMEDRIGSDHQCPLLFIIGDIQCSSSNLTSSLASSCECVRGEGMGLPMYVHRVGLSCRYTYLCTLIEGNSSP